MARIFEWCLCFFLCRAWVSHAPFESIPPPGSPESRLGKNLGLDREFTGTVIVEQKLVRHNLEYEGNLTKNLPYVRPQALSSIPFILFTLF